MFSMPQNWPELSDFIHNLGGILGGISDYLGGIISSPPRSSAISAGLKNLF